MLEQNANALCLLLIHYIYYSFNKLEVGKTDEEQEHE